MTFLNQPLLWGLLGIAIPIVIHLLNRRKAAVVEWGAMRFLLASLASRNRRILLEEGLLMAVRCLAVGLIAAAMSRPLLSSGGGRWAVVLAVLPAVAVLGAVAAILWPRRGVRWACLGTAAAIVLAAGAALAREDWALGRQWAGEGSSQDIAIVLDGSLSMTVRTGGLTNFQRALEPARAAIVSCRPSDTVSIFLGGTSPQEVVAPGISDRKELLARLETLRPSLGSLRVIPSLLAAGEALAKGHNAGKKIVLITDGQAVGWDLPGGAPGPSAAGGQNEERWRWLGANLARPGLLAPKVVCRFLPAPASFANLCVEEVKFSRNVVGPDRPVRIEVKVANTGESLQGASGVELLVDGVPAGRQGLEEIPPHGSGAVHFQRQFEKPGARLIEARLAGADDLPGDDSGFARLNVLEELPVLIVEGAPSAEPLGGASAFVQVALAPGASQPAARPAPAASAPQEAQRDLVRPRVVGAGELAGLDLSRYRVVVLAGVPALPEAAAGDLAAFVQRGGGLLILPGEFQALGADSPARFYETWTSAGGKPMAPGRPLRLLADLESPAHLAPRTFAHPALEVLADPVRRDAGAALIHSYWELQVDEKDPDVRIGGRLDTGHPFLADRRVGLGRVLLLAISLDQRQSNLPGLKGCFVPLVHELVYYLAGATADRGNIQAGQEASLDLPAWLREAAAASGGLLEVLTPLHSRRPAQAADLQGAGRLVFWGAEAPGAYRVVVPPSPRRASSPADQEDLFFVVANDPQESRMERLSPADLQAARKHVPISLAGSTQELTAFLQGGTPGMEIWQGLALLAVLALLAESALARWIARRRGTHAAVPVAFGQEPLDVQSFRQHAREMLAVPDSLENRNPAIGSRGPDVEPRR